MEERFDPFAVEILKDKLAAAADEMGVVLARTSMSPIVYEVLDFACGLTDAQARVVAQTNGLTLFTGTFGPQVESLISDYGLDGMREGDVFATNVPYRGGTHTCDVCLVKPIFVDGGVIAFAVSITHWIEIGGAVPGSIPPDATEIFQEGLQLPGVRVYDAGHRSEAIVDLIAANIRLPRTGLGDLNAGVAAVAIGERRVLEARERYGLELVLASFERVLEHGEQTARAALRRIPNGVYRAEDVIDGDGVSDTHLPIAVTVTLGDDWIHADFTGCAPQAAGPVNCATGALLSACKTVVRAITAPDARSNDGFFAPFSLTIPPGTVFSAEPPAPTGWYYEGAAFANDLLWKALAPACPERLGAGSYTSLCCSYVVGRDAETDELFVLAEPNVGGWGGSALGDGESALIATTDGDTYNFPAEVVEARFPVLVERYELNVGAGGGAGRHRGGFGVVREYRLRGGVDAYGYGSIGGSERRPWAVGGGDKGTTNYLEYVRGASVERHGRVARVPLADGELVRSITGTGGGFGDPREREPERIREDVLDGYVSLAHAREVYGVALDPRTLELDLAGTAALRGG
ncbi:MAG TPA: hydantoinase B/oxoprolinase family protein [Gaiellaceae bacterium]|nr:hydantoinase B/oxoprolinase family protein [Gaiellaceae bacterium]